LQELRAGKFGDLLKYYRAIDDMEKEENQRMIDIISFPHANKQTRQRILNTYLKQQKQNAGDGKIMALRFGHMTKKIGQKWPGEKSK